MREIKFRVWINGNQSCIDDHDFSYLQDAHNKGYDGVILEQFTGLKDENGRDIYEGDIITASWHFDSPHVVEWPEDVYVFRVFAIEDELTIIGNIHENPELLK